MRAECFITGIFWFWGCVVDAVGKFVHVIGVEIGSAQAFRSDKRLIISGFVYGHWNECLFGKRECFIESIQSSDGVFLLETLGNHWEWEVDKN